MSIERDDFGSGQNDRMFFPMPALTRPHGSALDDYAILSGLADRLGVFKDFTEGRTVMEWLRHLYDEWRDSLASRWPVPGFDEFWAGDGLELPVADGAQVAFADFRADPEGHPLSTPTGKIEITSPRPSTAYRVSRTALATWCGLSRTSGSSSAEDASSVCNFWSPTSRKARLHCSQPGRSARARVSRGQDRRAGSERTDAPLPDAAARGLRDGDLVRIFNDRGACLAGLAVDDAVRAGVAQLSTGAWYDPDPADPGFCSWHVESDIRANQRTDLPRLPQPGSCTETAPAGACRG